MVHRLGFDWVSFGILMVVFITAFMRKEAFYCVAEKSMASDINYVSEWLKQK